MAPSTADHLCVLVHGLWGNPSHMQYLASSLKSRYDDSQLIVHVAAKNSGNYTYDGIELGGERLAREIEDLIEEYAERGVTIRKFSITGYSLGGLVSRYAVGVLYSKGIFSKIQPINFTTFASPHLGVRTPKLGFRYHIWNVLGARTLSASGRQLFMIDKFRDTQRPLLSILADKELAFWKALALFKNRVLYANIINDKSTNWFTSGISRYDQFTDLDMIEYKYLPGYDNVLIDDEVGISLKPPPAGDEDNNRVVRGARAVRDFIRSLPFIALYSLLIPVGIGIFLVNAGVQTYSSSKRIRLHSPELKYNIPLMANEVQETVDSMMDSINQSQTPDHLPDLGDEEASHSNSNLRSREISPMTTTTLQTTANSGSVSSVTLDSESKLKLDHSLRIPEFPTLALAPYQFDMIDSLDQLKFKKIPVHIHKVRHSHAAIIVRNPKNENFSEGKVVIRHWLDEMFEV